MEKTCFYKDFMYKSLKPKSDVIESLLEANEQKLVKLNDMPTLYNVSVPTQDDVWICGRVYSQNAGSGGGGKLTEHNVAVQGSYVCSNSHSISLNLSDCPEYSLFPGQIVLLNGRNPDGKRFLCKSIIEPPFVSEVSANKPKMMREDGTPVHSINIPLAKADDELTMIVSAGPYMTNGAVNTTVIDSLMQVVKTKRPNVLLMLGPYVDMNHDQISSGNIPCSYEELMQKILELVAEHLKNTRIHIVIQPSLHDATLEPIYPMQPIHVSPLFVKQNELFHFVQEPCMLQVNETLIAVTTTDVVKDLTTMTVSKSSSSDRIGRNFAHMLRQASFYPIYPPPDHVCIDYEAWHKYARIDKQPKIFIAVSDLANFVKEVNSCVCFNPGKLVRGTSTGSYAHLVIPDQSATTAVAAAVSGAPSTQSNIAVTFHKL